MRASFFSAIHHPDPDRPRRRPSRATTTLASCVLLALLALAGCGITTTTRAAPGGAGASPSATAAAHNAACPGPTGSVNDAGTPALVLTEKSANHSGSAAVGTLVQVRLSDAWHWDYLSTSAFAPLLPAGVHDASLAVCAWNFRPQKAGSVTLHFARSAICHPGVPCPMYIQQVSFTLQVTS